MDQKALTLTGKGILRVLNSPLKVSPPVVDLKNPPTSMYDCIGIWDTGASSSFITQKVVDALSLKPTGMTEVKTAGGSHTSPTFLVAFILPNNVIIGQLKVPVGTIAGGDVLIGMDVITLGDFSVSNFEGITRMSFRIPSSAKIDYVREIDLQKRFDLGHAKKKTKSSKKKRKKRKK